MAFKLIEAAQNRWPAVNDPHLVAHVRAGATFVNGQLVERPDDHHQPEARLKILIHSLNDCSCSPASQVGARDGSVTPRKAR